MVYILTKDNEIQNDEKQKNREDDKGGLYRGVVFEIDGAEHEDRFYNKQKEYTIKVERHLEMVDICRV